MTIIALWCARIVALLLLVAFLAGCASTPFGSAPCFLSERHAQDLTVQDHPVVKTPLPAHVDQNITDRQALADAVARYNDLRKHVQDHCQCLMKL